MPVSEFHYWVAFMKIRAAPADEDADDHGTRTG